MGADFIIAGAGSAGCVLANKLTEDPNISVLLLEAGPEDRHPLIHMPRGVGKIYYNDDVMWKMPVTKPGSNEPEFWARGKVLGGSSSVNGMIYLRGWPENYDELEVPGWDWAHMGPIYKAMENHQLGEAEWRGVGGPLGVSVMTRGKPVCEAMISAAGALGIPRVDDMNAAPGEAAGYQPWTVARGERQSAAKTFIKPARSRPNLRILTETLALQIVFEGRRAVGVRIRDKSGDRIVRAGREVILTLGAIQTPKLLLASGVGPASQLRLFDIPVVADRRNVGENLTEQRLLGAKIRLSKSSDNDEFRGLRLLKNVMQYGLFRSGILTRGMSEVGIFAKSSPELPRPDGKISFSPYSLAGGVLDSIPEKEPGASFICQPFFPKSRGTLRLSSADPTAFPEMNANYLSDDHDKRSSIGLFQRMREIMTHPLMAEFGVQEITPGPDVQTDDEIVAAYKELGICGLHMVGTCRMGEDEESVVDPTLKVRGVEGLRVADISIYADLVAPNTNAPAMAAGWRAAQIIKNDLAERGVSSSLA